MTTRNCRTRHRYGYIVVSLFLFASACGTTSDDPTEAVDTTMAALSSEPATQPDVSDAGGSDGDSDDAMAQEAPAELASSEPDMKEQDAAGDVVGCTRVDEETIELEVVNHSSETSSYWLTVGYFDDAGRRLADGSEFIDNLRPGERAIESTYVFETEGTVCEVIDVDRFASESDAEEMAEISACEITGTDVFGDVEASVSATNSTSESSDYSIEVAFVDDEGVRRGTGSAFVEVVRPGETAPTDLFTTVDHSPGYRCEVVGVDRMPS